MQYDSGELRRQWSSSYISTKHKYELLIKRCLCLLMWLHFVGLSWLEEWQNLVSILRLVIKFIVDGAYPTLFSIPKGHFRWTLLTNSCDVILNTAFLVVFFLKLKWTKCCCGETLKLQSFKRLLWNSVWLRIQIRCILMHLDKGSMLISVN